MKSKSKRNLVTGILFFFVATLVIATFVGPGVYRSNFAKSIELVNCTVESSERDYWAGRNVFRQIVKTKECGELSVQSPFVNNYFEAQGITNQIQVGKSYDFTVIDSSKRISFHKTPDIIHVVESSSAL
jgi:hypothetical protein